MSHYDQQDQDQPFPKAITTALGSKKLIGHKDAEIRTIVACCLADLMRIYAPDTPFNDELLRVRAALPNPPALDADAPCVPLSLSRRGVGRPRVVCYRRSSNCL